MIPSRGSCRHNCEQTGGSGDAIADRNHGALHAAVEPVTEDVVMTSRDPIAVPGGTLGTIGCDRNGAAHSLSVTPGDA